MQKTKRLLVIEKIISEETISTQDELLKKLKAKGSCPNFNYMHSGAVSRSVSVLPFFVFAIFGFFFCHFVFSFRNILT